jgi:hypothetical protein
LLKIISGQIDVVIIFVNITQPLEVMMGFRHGQRLIQIFFSLIKMIFQYSNAGQVFQVLNYVLLIFIDFGQVQ